jgi:hypothetical protein
MRGFRCPLRWQEGIHRSTDAEDAGGEIGLILAEAIGIYKSVNEPEKEKED